MKNKFLVLVLSFSFLIAVFFFTKEKKEDQQEIELWNINPSSIKFFPPKEKSELVSKFSTDELEFEKKEISLKTSPLFWIKGKSVEGKNYFYEGNYNVKNLFSELSILRTKGLNEEKSEYLEKFQLNKELSPKIEIYSGSKLQKEITLGKDSDSSRYILTDNSIVLVQNFIFQKFTNSKFELRERNYVRAGEFELQRINYVKDSDKISLENQAFTKEGVNSSKWFKISGGKIRIEPSLGSTIYANLQSLKASIYPDEENGEGFEISEELVKNQIFANLEVQFTNGQSYTVKIYPKVVMKDKTYYPAIKEVDLNHKESVSYIEEDSVKKLIESFDRIKTATEWQEPKGK